MILKKSGVLDVIVEIFNSIMFVAGLIISHAVIIVESIILVFSGLFDVIDGLFNGDTGTMVGGLKKIGTGLLTMLLAGIFIVLEITVGLIAAVIGGFIIGIWDKWKDKSSNWWELAIRALSEVVAVAFAIRLAMAFPPWIRPFMVILGYVIGDLLATWVNKLIYYLTLGIAGEKAQGGPITRTGSYLVGERGPEIVRMPAGANVVPNHAIGGNTINVNVSGRVGASDREIRDIAQKVGRMVNMEINRNTSSNIRGA